MPLPIAPTNHDLQVVKVAGDSRIVKHLASLGIVEGATLNLIDSSSNGVVVSVLGSRLALGNDVARNIRVSPR